MLAAATAAAQGYPERPVTMIAPFPAGGSVDLVARAVARNMSEIWKQPVVVANRPGAGGNIGAEAVARATPDGYTLLMGTTALASSPALYSKLAYDVTRDLAPVSLVVTMTNVLVIHPSLPCAVGGFWGWRTGGTLNSASAGVGSSNHLALVLFNTMTGAEIAHIPMRRASGCRRNERACRDDMSTIAAAVPRQGEGYARSVTGAIRSATLRGAPSARRACRLNASWNALLPG
jgi:tripartite-type tricarboxylate transporter receptor subunit TctC